MDSFEFERMLLGIGSIHGIVALFCLRDLLMDDCIIVLASVYADGNWVLCIMCVFVCLSVVPQNIFAV